jgi:predicted transcriptional regulator
MEISVNDNEQPLDQTLAELTTEMVAAYVSKNSVGSSELPALIHSVYASLLGLSAPADAPIEKPVPAVPIKKSVTPDFIISLEDGRQFKSLKRHLSGRGMTPADYKAKWGLPSDYPMVAANYAAKRSELAKSLGLGQQRRKRNEPVTTDMTPKAKGGRPRKASVA